jgi:hypothetical protein
MRKKIRRMTLQRETLNRMTGLDLGKANGVGGCQTTKCSTPPGCTTAIGCTDNCSDVCSHN